MKEKNNKELWQIDSGYACAGVITENGKIIETAPIFKTLLGKNIAVISYKKTLVAINV